ncbi:MAG: hypothetical protein FWD93_05020 [Coriobacteriia bacterium]|nr:hypothetical protein [Coriobacteriia bacterium]
MRTVLQGFIASTVAYLPQFLNLWQLPEWLSLLLVLAVMAVLAPLMAKLGEYATCPSFDDCVVCDAEGNIMSLEQVLEQCPELESEEDFQAGDDNG